ncbi:SapC family protein [Caldichromatium japonicum]|uniref:SapC family protein n=1 Tax=Caldichromatium japonicum TaxID=2699430 RepID=A0A6G7VA53_9GAMM|nr:SapC family protein [Caldichromatium japonicum]QIK36790.1 SapC family protein [Caldichromatium japonicum]
MPTLVPLSRERHAQKCWRHWTSYAFAAQQGLVPLVAAEFPKATMALPIAFVQQGEAYLPVAVLGIEPGVNLFVAPDGRWLGGYVPAVLRSYPFSLAQTGEGQWALCIDEESGLLVAAGEGEPFFAAGGELAERVKAVMAVLQQVEHSRQTTVRACASLSQYGLIKPWPIRVKLGESQDEVEGLFQIDEGVLNRLADGPFLELRRVGALALAYCQLLSMQHIDLLGRLAAHRVQAVSPPPFNLEEPELIQFDWDALRKGGHAGEEG